MREAINFVWKASVAAEVLVGVRLLMQGLAGEYPALMTASCVLPVKSLLLMYFYSNAGTRDQARDVAQQLAPIEWALYGWLVFELFSRWTRSYKGIGRFGKILMGALLLVALLVSIAFWRVEWAALVDRQNHRLYYILNRVVWGILALFVTGFWMFFRNYPVSIAPNVMRHTRVTMFYFASNAVCELAFTMTVMKYITVLNFLIVTATTASFAVWAIVLTQKGQITPPSPRISPEDRVRVEKLNQELLDLMGHLSKYEAAPPKYQATRTEPVPVGQQKRR